MFEWILSVVRTLFGNTEESEPDPAADHGPVMIPGGHGPMLIPGG